jgi:hypothetical protein
MRPANILGLLALALLVVGCHARIEPRSRRATKPTRASAKTEEEPKPAVARAGGQGRGEPAKAEEPKPVADRAGGQGRAEPAKAEAEPKPVLVDGYGRNTEGAKQIALANARKKVEILLEERFPGWAPSAKQLDEDYLLQKGVIRLAGAPEEIKFKGEDRFQARAEVVLKDEYLQELTKQVQQERVQQRQGLLARVLAGLLVLLVVVGGYLRLEEATRGYYTSLLRLAALAVVGATAGVLWLAF